MALTALKGRTAGPGRHTDGHGLCLVVRPSGSRSWVLRMQYKGVRRDFGLGPVHDVSRSDARCLAIELRKMVRSGKDPVKERGLRRANTPTFEMVTRRCYEAMKKGWKDRRNLSWISSFENHVFDEIGAKRVDAIDSVQVLKVLEPIWMEKPDTARRLLQRIGTVLDYAHIKGHIPAEISLRLVTRGLPRQIRQVEHRAAMPYAAVPAFLQKLARQERTIGRDALQLTILTAVRSNETRYATWDEFDLDAATWSIAASRMKMKQPHVVPLSAPALALLHRMRAEHEALDGYIAPGRALFTLTGRKPISDTTFLKAIRDMKIDKITVHGFRSSFADWAAECIQFPKEITEKALAHRVPNAAEAAYRRTDYFVKRSELMAKWASFLMD
ncbi:tyrosine-type recombinase/integrase [Sphingomonas sp. BGYR3]|uniref:tyrosine-type recombinase/integrase n=1 Tax=Sphingomonas sp. BGYR3 TaxID=2975483 RepID=UPI0021A7EF65|nr:integrase arm-type DNA-binding domain-containing protein [Sphingomonas sp. BGYR3]MDG5487392.1 tyrosine-type recombinase/integrase [Sphingomonas sp. BGYR3]